LEILPIQGMLHIYVCDIILDAFRHRTIPLC